MVRLNPLDNESVYSLNGVGIEPPSAGKLTENFERRPASMLVRWCLSQPCLVDLPNV
jgi:hypothetical protein